MKNVFLVSLCFLLASCSSVMPAQATIPSELTIVEYPLKQPPNAEYAYPSFADSVEGNPLTVHAGERGNTFDWSLRSCPTNIPMGMCTKLGGDQLAAYEEFNNLGQGKVTVTRNGEEIYHISVGQGSPINGLRGLWVYKGHWGLETAHITNRTEDNAIYSDAVGQVTVDGVLLNDKFDYEDAFGFQTVHGKPFYFFKRNGKIDAAYDGVEFSLGYDEIPHYGCCSAAALNPMVYQNMVTFFARKGESWYYAEIGVFGQP